MKNIFKKESLNVNDEIRAKHYLYCYRIVAIFILFSFETIILYLKMSNVKTVLTLALTLVLTIHAADRLMANKIFKKYKKENENLKLYVKMIDDFNCELRRFKHNYLNILTTLYGYIEDTTNEDLKKYFNSIVDECKNVKTTNISGLSTIDSIPLKSLLTVKINTAMEQGIITSLFSSKDAKISNIKIQDLCEIVGVLFDNAIEETSKLHDDKRISVCIVKIDNYMVFEIRNKYLERPNLNSILEDGKSTKGKDRGFGLRSVRKILSQYDDKIALNTYLDEKEQSFVQELSILQNEKDNCKI